MLYRVAYVARKIDQTGNDLHLQERFQIVYRLEMAKDEIGAIRLCAKHLLNQGFEIREPQWIRPDSQFDHSDMARFKKPL